MVEPFLGPEGGPPTHNSYKRAVYKQAPNSFNIEILSPQKQGNNYSYGMRICPVRTESDRHSLISTSSSRSSSSMSEYEIWRRWEDCLHFQDTLEQEYAIMSREKRARLVAGKGVKKNGVYPHEDPVGRHYRAASFESLPPGPDPRMIAKDLHEVLPKLTKKGTLFRASSATVDQRAQEFSALIEALWRQGEDVPMLLVELRELRVVRDFFGYWRRDRDRVQMEKERDASGRVRTDSLTSSLGSARSSSVFGSAFGMYFSASNLSLQLPTTLALPERPSSSKGPAPTSPNGAIVTAASLRPRANTSQGFVPAVSAARLRSAPSSTTASPTSPNATHNQPGNRTHPPASAPAGVTFTFTMNTSSDEERHTDGGYVSDTTSVEVQKPPRSPRSAPPHSFQPMRLEKGKGRINAHAQEPATVPQDREKLDVPLDEQEEQDQDIVLRAHEHLIPHTLEPLFEDEVQQLTLDDVDRGERESDRELGPIQELHLADGEEPVPMPAAIPRTQRKDAPAANRNGLIFMSPPNTLTEGEDDEVSSFEGRSSAEHHSPALLPSRESQSPALVDPAAAAPPRSPAPRAAASSPRPASPGMARYYHTPSASSRRASWASSLASTLPADAHAHEAANGHVNGVVRPVSTQSSAASCADIESRYPSSPIVLHMPLYEEEFNASNPDVPVEADPTRHRNHDSVSSFRSIMTDCSADAIIPRRTTSLQRSLSSDSHRHNRHSQSSALSGPREWSWAEDGEDLIDSYMFAPLSSRPTSHDDSSITIKEFQVTPVTSPGREHVRGSLASPDNFPKPFRNRPPGQFHLPWTPTAGGAARLGSPTSPVGEDAIAIKAVLGESIVAFRADRTITLHDVREKLLEKFVRQQGMPLSNAFSLGYRLPATPARAGPGRTRSSSVSSVGILDRGQLRIVFTQVEWQEAVATCGAKLTLQVLDGSG